MKSNHELVEYLKASGVLSSKEIIAAFIKVDRADFLPDPHFGVSYVDAPLSIGYGQTISQPTTVAIMLELLNPQNKDHILDIGSGSGWTTALLANIVGAEGSVAGLEIIPELVEFGKRNLAKYNFPNASISLAKGTCRSADDSPTLHSTHNHQSVQPQGFTGTPGIQYDKILVSASAEKFPSGLLDQLKNNGRLVIPVQNSIWLYQKDKDGKISKKEHPGFVFVPLK